MKNKIIKILENADKTAQDFPMTADQLLNLFGVMPSLPFSDKTLMDAILKVYPKDDIKNLAQETRNERKFYLGDKEIGFRPNDSTSLRNEYIDGFEAGFNYVKNLFIEGGKNGNEA